MRWGSRRFSIIYKNTTAVPPKIAGSVGSAGSAGPKLDPVLGRSNRVVCIAGSDTNGKPPNKTGQLVNLVHVE